MLEIHGTNVKMGIGKIYIEMGTFIYGRQK